MNCHDHLYRGCHPRTLSRRWFLQQCGVGLGGMALGQLLASHASAETAATALNPLAPRPGHYPAKAKNVIFLFMAGAPSHLELFDNKPHLAKFDGTLPPPDLLKGYRAAFINPNSNLLGPKFKFARHGRSGAELSELLPHLAEVVDDVAIVRGMTTDAFNHAPGQILMSTGSQQFGRPSLGSWITYGLGSESQDLPGWCSAPAKKGPAAATATGAAAFCPPSIRACSFAAAAIPCCICRIRRASTARCRPIRWPRFAG